MPELVFAVILMVAPTASDISLETQSFGLGFYPSIEECEQAVGWITEHRGPLQRHMWCEEMPDE